MKDVIINNEGQITHRGQIMHYEDIQSYFILDLIIAVKKKGGTSEDIYRLITAECENIVDEIAELIVQAATENREKISK
ncbi:hypothetical protein HZB04_03025 [Candidatus Wolfebacteria bacterium]|nr:hypothetical protein [Candidatus Wolfebacteria bacterium]